MSDLKILNPEILEAFDACETKEELLAKAAELNVELTEENIAELMDEVEIELDDDELDEIAGGGGEGERGWWKQYKRVYRRDDCCCGQWVHASVPAFKGVKKNGKCGNHLRLHRIHGTNLCDNKFDAVHQFGNI